MKIEKGNMTIEDTMDILVETKDGITCGCEKPRLKMTCHVDGRDFYGYQYSCSCGNQISMECKRDKDDMMMYLE